VHDYLSIQALGRAEDARQREQVDVRHIRSLGSCWRTEQRRRLCTGARESSGCLLFFANDNVEPFERRVIEDRGIAEVRLAEAAADPSGAADAVVNGWARQFERLLVHLDVDVLDFVNMPLAENTPNRR
jgi:hypothetical protein